MKLETIESLQTNPLSLLSCECALALGAFIFGYKAAIPSAASLVTHLATHFPGPDQADACTRAYLSARDTREAFRNVLDILSSTARKKDYEVATQQINESFVDVVRDAIIAGQANEILAEASVTWLADFASGYLSGVREIDLRAAVKQQSELRAFEGWLRSYYGGFRAPWYGLIRVHEGACERGLRRFVELWDEFRGVSLPSI